MKTKMNACFKIGFIFLLVCAALLAGALIFGYVLSNEKACMFMSMGGIVLAFAGLILVLVSKPKKQKPHKAKPDENVDNENQV